MMPRIMSPLTKPRYGDHHIDDAEDAKRHRAARGLLNAPARRNRPLTI